MCNLVLILDSLTMSLRVGVSNWANISYTQWKKINNATC